MFMITKSQRRTGLLLLAEFFIVVISVLAAIWLENVRQQSKDRALEKQYLEELEEELDEEELDAAQEELESLSFEDMLKAAKAEEEEEMLMRKET